MVKGRGETLKSLKKYLKNGTRENDVSIEIEQVVMYVLPDGEAIRLQIIK